MSKTNKQRISMKIPYQKNTNSAKTEARTNIKFMVKIGKRDGETNVVLPKGHGNNAPKKSAVYKWITHFKKG